jgi:hypothetical protein
VLVEVALFVGVAVDVPIAAEVVGGGVGGVAEPLGVDVEVAPGTGVVGVPVVTFVDVGVSRPAPTVVVAVAAAACVASGPPTSAAGKKRVTSRP